MRIALFLGMQLAVVLLVGIVSSVLMNLFSVHIDSMSYYSLLFLCMIMGAVGSVISLFMSKMMCKTAYKVKCITHPDNSQEAFLINTISSLCAKEGIKMPEVGIYPSADPNAFATGATKDSALIAVSSGLLNSMSENEIKGVLGHEIGHIKNGDMVTMALLQGVLNTFVYFFSFIVSQIIVSAMQKNSDSRNSFARGATFYLINSLMQMVFGLFATMILMWFSRFREYKADAFSADLSGKMCMISALEALKRGIQPEKKEEQSYMQALCINGAVSVSELFMSHPPLDKRIAALKDR